MPRPANDPLGSETAPLPDDIERRVALRTAALEAANRELEAFSYSVSHDLRSPVRAMTGFTRILLEEESEHLSERGRHYVEVVHESAVRMGELVDGLLSFARVGRQGLQRRAVDPEAIVRRALDELDVERAGRDVEVIVGDLAPCFADATLLHQVYVNLLSNALKFTRGRERAVIEVACGPDEGPFATYFVRDDGVGFDMRYAGRLFGVFQRLHEQGDFEGNGIGLALVQRIVQRHGGRVWAQAEPGAGATFTFTLERR